MNAPLLLLLSLAGDPAAPMPPPAPAPPAMPANPAPMAPRPDVAPGPAFPWPNSPPMPLAPSLDPPAAPSPPPQPQPASPADPAPGAPLATTPPQPTLPTPPEPTPPRLIKVAVLDLLVGDGAAPPPAVGRTLLADQLSELRFLQLVGPADMALLPGVAALLELLGDSEDPGVLSKVGKAAGVDLVVAGSIKVSGTWQLSTLQLVDVRSGRAEWRQTAQGPAGSDSAIQSLREQASALATYLAHAHGPPMTEAGLQPTPSIPPRADQARSEAPTAPPSKASWFNGRRGVGVALVGMALALLPAAPAALLLSGLGHLLPGQLVFTGPGTTAPRYHSYVFTLTWGDAMLAGGLAAAALTMLGIGAVLVLIP